MRADTPPELHPEDLLNARVLLVKVFQGMLPFHSIHFYFPDRPQSALSWKEGGNLEEVWQNPGVEAGEMHYDGERKRLFYPLSFHKKSLGFLVFFGFPHPPDPQERRMLHRLSVLALEMISLKKQVQLDPATGFFNETAFRKDLTRLVKTTLGGLGERIGRKMSLAETHPERSMVLGFLSLEDPAILGGDPLGERFSMSRLRDLRQRFPEGTMLAAVRHHPLVIGFVIPEGVGEVKEAHSFLKEEPFPGWGGYYLGWAAFHPYEQESFQGNPSPFGLVVRWWEQAWTALQAARNLGMNTILGYQEILSKAGKVMDLLPGHRIVINLGEKAGVKYHMRFSVIGGEKGQEKGVAVPLDIQEEISIAEVIYLEESGGTPKKKRPDPFNPYRIGVIRRGSLENGVSAGGPSLFPDVSTEVPPSPCRSGEIFFDPRSMGRLRRTSQIVGREWNEGDLQRNALLFMENRPPGGDHRTVRPGRLHPFPAGKRKGRPQGLGRRFDRWIS